MNLLDVLRRLLGFGDRRLHSKLGVNRRLGERRGSDEITREAAEAELERMAWIKWKGPRNCTRCGSKLVFEVVDPCPCQRDPSCSYCRGKGRAEYYECNNPGCYAAGLE